MIPLRRHLLLPLLITAGVLGGCEQSESSTVQQMAPVVVRALSVEGGEAVAEPLRFAGIVQARQRATLTFQVSGVLRERAVELGDAVEEGQLLARVYNPALAPARDSAMARLKELETRLAQSERELKRATRLFEQELVAEQTLEQLTAERDGLRASVETARAAVEETRQLLAESVLRAPFAGHVQSLMVEEDEFVRPGQSVLALSSPAGREVEVRLPAYLLSDLVVGQSLPVWTVRERRQGPVQGRLSEISQPGSARGELHPIKVALPGDGLEPGTPVEVGVTPRLPGELRLPVLSVMRSGDGASVFRLEQGRAHRVPVTLLRMMGEQVVVSSGALAAGDQVVYAGMTRLAEGDAVEVRQ